AFTGNGPASPAASARGGRAPCAGQVRQPGQDCRLGPRAAHHPPGGGAAFRAQPVPRGNAATPRGRGVVRPPWGWVGVSRARPARHATSRGAGPALQRRMCWGAMCVLRAAPVLMRERVNALRTATHAPLGFCELLLRLPVLARILDKLLICSNEE